MNTAVALSAETDLAIARDDEPRVGRLFAHVVYTTGYHVDGHVEPVLFEITDVSPDGRVFYGPAQRGMETTATLWIWRHRFASDALGAWAGERTRP